MDVLIVILFLFWSFFLVFLENYIEGPFFKWLFIIPFCILVANRSELVPDTDAYISYFSNETINLLDYSNDGFEIGFRFLSKVIKLIVGYNSSFYFGIISLINLLLVDYSLTKIGTLFFREQCISENTASKGNNLKTFHILGLLLYVAYFGIYVNAIVLRIGIAFSILIYASTLALKNEKKIRDYLFLVICVFLSYFLHTTSLIGIIVFLILILSKQYTKKIYIGVLIIVLIIYLTNIFSPIGELVFSYLTSGADFSITKKLMGYEEGDRTALNQISFKFIFYFLSTLYLVVNSIKSTLYFKYLNVLVFGLFIYSIFRSVLLVERVTDFFIIFSFLVYYLYLIHMSKSIFWTFLFVIIFFQIIFILRIVNPISL